MDCRDKPGNDIGVWGGVAQPSPSSSRNSRQRISGIGEPGGFSVPSAVKPAPTPILARPAAVRDDGDIKPIAVFPSRQ